MKQRYGVRQDDRAWTIFDTFTGRPVVIIGVPQVGLDIEDASRLVELLNTSEVKPDRN